MRGVHNMPRNLQPQRQAIQSADPYYGEYSRLAEQFLRPNKPVHSVGQGIADVLGDVGEAWFLKEAAQKEKASQDKDYSDVAMAQRLAMDSGLAKDQRSGALYSAQDFGGLQTQGIDPMSAQQRGAAAIGQISQQNPRAALAASPGIMEIAQQFEPPVKWQDVPQPGGGTAQRNPQTNQMVNVVPGRAGPEQSPLAKMLAERDALPQGDPKRTAYDAAITQATTREPRAPNNVQTETFDDGIFVIQPDGSRGARLGNSPARERQPRMKTYWSEDGSYQQLDASNEEDQKTIRDLGLTDKAPTDSERTAKGFLDRMEAAETEIDKILEGKPEVMTGLYDAVVKKIPLLGNAMVSDDYQTAMQKIKDWVRAKLRKESGAVIGDEEALDEFKTYFAIPGDNENTLSGKKGSRLEARKQLATSAGILGRPFLKGLNNTGAPKAGAVEGGYRFKGGNPADKNNWVPVDG